jgi:nitrile hydratase
VTGNSGLPIGSRVRVRPGPPEAHCRTPFYLRGREGVVVDEVGTYRDPSRLAYHKPGLPMRRLFRVRFRQRDLWPEYGSDSDSLYADLYDNWLEPADAAAAPQQEA